MATIKSYLDWFHYETNDIEVHGCVEGGDCEQCGRGGQQFYCHREPGDSAKLCERCAREWAGVPQRQPGQPENIGSVHYGYSD